MRLHTAVASLFKITLLLLICSTYLFGGFDENYWQIDSTKKMKSEFKEILLPKIEEINSKILQERAFVKGYFDTKRAGLTHDQNQTRKLRQLAKKYRIKNLYNETAYLIKISTIPPSLALAQAATESAWGKSRFVKEANNIYGEWTYGKNGIVPKERENGKTHKIKTFDSLKKSIESYMLNLNRNAAYLKFRRLRYSKEASGEKFSGVDGASMMHNYSAIGEEYNKILKKIITSNRWYMYD